MATSEYPKPVVPPRNEAAATTRAPASRSIPRSGPAGRRLGEEERRRQNDIQGQQHQSLEPGRLALASDVAGDGTTTATILAQAIYREGLKNVAAGANPMDLKRGISLISGKIQGISSQSR